MKLSNRFFSLSLSLFALLILFLPATSVAVTDIGTMNSPTQNANAGPIYTGAKLDSTDAGPTYTGPAAESGDGVTLKNPLKVNSLEELITAILAAVVKLGAIILTLAIIWVGFLFVKAQGNAEEVTAARRALVWTVIGGLILLGAQAISTVISSTASNL